MRNSVLPATGVGAVESVAISTISSPPSHQNNNTNNTHSTDHQGDGRGSGDGKVDDMADGMDVFSKEAFEPLLTSNQYQVRKLAAQALMDVALMMANISQLRTLVALGPDHSQNFYLMTSMVACSLVCQVLFAVLMFVILVRETDMQQKKDYLDNLKLLEESGVSRHTTAQVRQSVLNMKEYQHHRTTGHLNYITMVLVFLITVLNMFITGFGIKDTD